MRAAVGNRHGASLLDKFRASVYSILRLTLSRFASQGGSLFLEHPVIESIHADKMLWRG
jgi:hypothetical protein